MFKELYELDVKDKVEQKNGLNYLSWAWAWAEIKKLHEDAKYEIKRYGEKQLPYVFDEQTGYMVGTELTIDGITHEMWLPVMDNANMPMLDHDYEYETKKGMKTCKKATMFDINKTIMRCLTKNIAMFGLGLSLYQGEDLPTVATKEEALKMIINFGKYEGKTLEEIQEINPGYIDWLRENSKDINIRAAAELLQPGESEEDINKKIVMCEEIRKLMVITLTEHDDMLKYYKVEDIMDLSLEQMEDCIKQLEKKKKKLGV